VNSSINDIFTEIDAWVAAGDYIQRGNAAATGTPYSPATDVIAHKVSSLYGDIFATLGDAAEYANGVRDLVIDNTRMAREIAAAARRGEMDIERALSIMEILAMDSERKAEGLEASYG